MKVLLKLPTAILRELFKRRPDCKYGCKYCQCSKGGPIVGDLR